MGLDTRITIITKDINNSYIDKFDYYRRSRESKLIELCYWRGCKGLNDDIAKALNCPTNGKVRFYLKDISTIGNILIDYYDKDYWDKNAKSIWEYYQYENSLKRNIENLKWLEKFLVESPETECYFSESY